MRKTLCLLPLASALLLSGCISLAPEYERPEAPVEQVWPQDEATKNAELLTEGLQKWSDFFTDERLTKLIELGLQNNRSLRSAFYSVEQARAQYNVSRADLLPSECVGFAVRIDGGSYAGFDERYGARCHFAHLLGQRRHGVV